MIRVAVKRHIDRLAFGVWRSAFGVRRSAFGVRRSAAAKALCRFLFDWRIGGNAKRWRGARER